jgi:N-dimethylarginine dimethylaminohydrolase
LKEGNTLDKWSELKTYITNSINLLEQMANASRIEEQESLKLLYKSFGIDLVLQKMEQLEKGE